MALGCEVRAQRPPPSHRRPVPTPSSPLRLHRDQAPRQRPSVDRGADPGVGGSQVAQVDALALQVVIGLARLKNSRGSRRCCHRGAASLPRLRRVLGGLCSWSYFSLSEDPRSRRPALHAQIFRFLALPLALTDDVGYVHVAVLLLRLKPWRAPCPCCRDAALHPRPSRGRRPSGGSAWTAGKNCISRPFPADLAPVDGWRSAFACSSPDPQ